jgi:hypothetical protein
MSIYKTYIVIVFATHNCRRRATLKGGSHRCPGGRSNERPIFRFSSEIVGPNPPLKMTQERPARMLWPWAVKSSDPCAAATPPLRRSARCGASRDTRRADDGSARVPSAQLRGARSAPDVIHRAKALSAGDVARPGHTRRELSGRRRRRLPMGTEVSHQAASNELKTDIRLAQPRRLAPGVLAQ